VRGRQEFIFVAYTWLHQQGSVLFWHTVSGVLWRGCRVCIGSHALITCVCESEKPLLKPGCVTPLSVLQKHLIWVRSRQAQQD